MLTEEQKIQIEKECTFATSRAGGKGGQNVNKVETRVEATFDVAASQALSQAEKDLLYSKDPDLAGGMRTASDTHRTQLRNKADALEKLFARLEKLLHVPRKRKATRPSRSSKEKKLQEKKHKGEIKSLRQKLR